MLQKVRHRYRSQLNEILQTYISNRRGLTQLLLDSPQCGGLVLTEETIYNPEQLSRNWCFALHRSRSEILGLKLSNI